MLPLAQSLLALQVNDGCESGTQPPWMQTSPLGHAPPSPHGAAQWFCAQTVPFGQTPASAPAHGVGFPVQSPLPSHV